MEFLYYTTMNQERDNRELEHRIDLLEERMNTQQANIDATLNALRTDIERGKNDQIKWTIGVVAVAVIIIIGVLS